MVVAADANAVGETWFFSVPGGGLEDEVLEFVFAHRVTSRSLRSNSSTRGMRQDHPQSGQNRSGPSPTASVSV
jgi:hypothetical protein